MNKKSYTHMSVEERETLSLGLAQGHALRKMATLLGRAIITNSRKSARNTTKGHPYRASIAHMLPRSGRDSLDGRLSS